MKRILTTLVAIAVVVPCVLMGTSALAQTYPSKPIKLTVPFLSGGGSLHRMFRHVETTNTKFAPIADSHPPL